MENIVFNNLESLKKKSNLKDFDKEYDDFKEKITKRFLLNPDCIPIFIVITGSVSYSLDLETSDIDGKGVYIQDLYSILNELRIGQANPLSYKSQLSGTEKDANGKIKEDITLYELGRYLELIQSNNPNIMELYNSNQDCIVYKHPIWDELVEKLKTSNVLTKKCYYSFSSYASQQIKKATGTNKKINNPIDKIRKTPIDFCFVINPDDSTTQLKSYLKKNKLDQKMCGLVKVPHAKDLYGLYYDYEADKSFSCYIKESVREKYRKKKLLNNESMGFGYKGIIKESLTDEISDEIRVSSIPKGEVRLIQISYNKDGYMKYCKDYTAMWGKNGWIVNRNEERYNDNISSGQNYDGKNLSHCLRLLYMAREIAEGKGVIVERTSEQRFELLEVKKGRWSYENIMNKCVELTNGLEEIYKNSDLPKNFSYNTIEKILFEFIKKFYKL